VSDRINAQITSFGVKEGKSRPETATMGELILLNFPSVLVVLRDGSFTRAIMC
jgi:hypothetical protein